MVVVGGREGEGQLEGCSLALTAPASTPQLRSLIPQGDTGPSPHITVAIHLSIPPARRLIRSALASSP